MTSKTVDPDMKVAVKVFDQSDHAFGYFILPFGDVTGTVRRGYLHCWKYKDIFMPNEIFQPHSDTPDADDSSINGRFTLLPVIDGLDLKGFKIEGDTDLIRGFSNFEEIH